MAAMSTLNAARKKIPLVPVAHLWQDGSHLVRRQLPYLEGPVPAERLLACILWQASVFLWKLY